MTDAAGRARTIIIIFFTKYSFATEDCLFFKHLSVPRCDFDRPASVDLASNIIQEHKIQT